MVRRRSMALLNNSKTGLNASSTIVGGGSVHGETGETVPSYRRGSVIKDPEIGYAADKTGEEMVDEKAAVRDHAVRRVS